MPSQRKTIVDLQIDLARINRQLYKARKQIMMKAMAKLRASHGLTRLIEARETCFEAAEVQGNYIVARHELAQLEILLDLDTQEG